MIEQEEEVANLADELRAKPQLKSSFFWLGIPIYWGPVMLLAVLCIIRTDSTLTLEIARYWMIGISILVSCVVIIGAFVTLWFPKPKSSTKGKKPLGWRDFWVHQFIICSSLVMGASLGLFWTSFLYGISLILVLFVAKIIER